jgi:deferrochelatase/peroxidase EfeB
VSRRITRGKLLASAGAGGLTLAIGGGLAAACGDAGQAVDRVVPFFGDHQSGIATPAQDRLHFAAFDVISNSKADVRDLLRTWSEAAARMCAGERAGPVNDLASAPPDDTGEAVGLETGRLTVTFGLGMSLFEKDGTDRFGLRQQRPEKLVELPAFAGDTLDPLRSGGDLCVQACSDDPQVAFHAVRNLARLGRGVVVMRWSQLGFGRTSSTSRSQETPRNLLGFKDGTNNIKLEDGDALDRHVWVGDADQPAWMHGGSYLVARRIRMLIEVWDRTFLQDQEQTIGRVKDSGAPLGATSEFDSVNLRAVGADGSPVVPVDAHIRLASPAENDNIRILRRGYSFTDGIDERLGQLDAGLFFISFQRDPQALITLQTRLGRHDALNEYITHTGSGIFAIPPGAQRGSYVGQQLLG